MVGAIGFEPTASWSRTRRQALSKLTELFRSQVVLVEAFAAHPQQFLAQRQQPIGGDISNRSGLLNSRILAPPDRRALREVAQNERLSPSRYGRGQPGAPYPYINIRRLRAGA